MAESLARRLRALAERIARIQPLNHDPERYFVERDAIRREILREAAALEAPRRVAAPPLPKFEPGAFPARGRIVRAEIRRARRLKEAACPAPSVWKI